jgi:site-specific recombinase XerD
MTALKQKFIDEMELRGFSANTTRSYVSVVRDVSRHFNRSPDQITDEELKQYLLYRIRQDKCAAATMVVNVSALRFFYQHVIGRCIEELAEALPRMRKPLVRPRAYSPEQVEKLLSAEGLSLKHRALLTTTYAAGLRVSEVCHLKAIDILSARMQIRIEQSKGNKDRFVVLSPKLLEILRVYWKAYRPRHWLFPGDSPEKPLTRISALKVFYRAVTLSGLPKLGGIHCLRHSYATHCLEAGVDVVTLKSLLGHSKLATTANYLHISQKRLDSIHSPLDRITLNLSSNPG